MAKRISTERYVVLDAKNHLCYPVPSDFFERPDGTLETFLEDYTLHPMRKTLENTLSFWALDPSPYLGKAGKRQESDIHRPLTWISWIGRWILN